MQQPLRGPWTVQQSTGVVTLRHFTVHRDVVITPAGMPGSYEWVDTADHVRVAAVDDEGRIYLIRQHHYLPNKVMWQLPGGAVDDGEQPADAARRELAEEVGAQAGIWRHMGAVWPMPGLTPARVHLWLAEQLHLTTSCPEPSEADLTAAAVPLRTAFDAARDGRIGCSASAQLVLTVWIINQMDGER